MSTLQGADLQAALDRCAEEPVHIIGQIQPHGLLFALSEPDLVVRQVSANVATVLGTPPGQILGQPFEAVLGQSQFQLFQAQPLHEDSPFPSPTRLRLGKEPLEFDCQLHRHDGVLIVELEQIHGAESLTPFNLNGHIRLSLSRLEETSNVLELCQAASLEIRRLSGFDRAMVYRFDADWNGEVIAEAKSPDSTSYFGLRFPASDIPVQARRLLLLNRLRTIVDINAVPAAILSESDAAAEKPLDLTFSLLRSPAAVHLEYLRNMGVQASLTVSLIVRGQLWGLIACHHNSRRHVDQMIRAVCDVVGRKLGSQVTVHIENAALQLRLASRNLLNRYMDELDAAKSQNKAECIQGERLLEFFAADALVSHLDGVVSYYGYAEEAGALLPVVAQLRANASRGVASSNCLSELHADAASYPSRLSGALYIGLTEEAGDYLLLLRRELVETIAWAGNPDKSLQIDSQGRLSPRNSFQSWRETVRGRSRPWTELDLENGFRLREQLLRRTETAAMGLSARRYEFLADTMPQLIWCAKPDGQGEYYNRRWISYTGLSLQQSIERGWQEAIHPDDLSNCVERWKKTIATQCDYELEVRIKRASDGAYRWHLGRAFPLRNQRGEVIQWVGTATDIEDQKQTRERLQLAIAESTIELSLAKEQLQTVLDGATSVSIIAADVQGVITVFNSGSENMLGYSAREVVGQLTPQIIHLESEVVARGLELSAETGRTVEGFDVFVEYARQGRHEEREWTYIRKDGSHLTVNLVVTALRDSLGTITGFLGVAMDVTARKRAEAASRASDENLRLIVGAVEDYALIMLDPEGRVVSWNLGAERIAGYSAAEIVGQHFSCFYFPEDIEKKHPDEELRIAAAQGRYAEESRRRRKYGSSFWADVVITAIHDERGNLRGFAKVVHDITERRKTEERFQLVVEAAPSAMIMVGHDALISLVNTQTENLFGYSRHELLGRPIEILLPEQFRPRHGAHLAGFFAAASQRSMAPGRELFGRRKDGSQVPVEIGLTPINTSQGQFVLASVIDITERKKTEKQLRDQALILDLANDSIFIRDSQDRVTYWNEGAQRLYGWSKDEALGRVTHTLLKTHFPQPLADIQAQLLAKGHWHGELVHTRRDASVITVASTWTLRCDDANQVASVLELNHDITARKRADAELLGAQRSLERHVAELAAANKGLAEKNEEVEAFVYIVSHDLRTPLVNLQGFCKELELSCEELRERLSSSIPDPRAQTILNDDIPGALRYVGASSTKFHRLINALLELSRYGRQEYRSEELSLAELVQSSLDLLQLSIATRGIQVCVGPLPAVRGDPTALGQVFANLIGNAIKYLQPGRPGQIEVGAEPRNGFVHCWVRDNGAGLPASAKARLFQVFQRFHPALAEGEGMGLAIVRRVVERHGGKIWAEGEEGVGTTFHFTLPAAGG